jgi:hypothetical protein
MDGDDGVQPFVFPGKQSRKFQAIDFRGERAKLALDFRRDVLSLAAELEIRIEIGKLLGELLVRLDLFFQTLALGENLLGSFRVLPEIRLGYLLLEGLELAAAGRSVKENSAVPGCEISVGQIRVAVLQACGLRASGFRIQLSASTSNVEFHYSLFTIRFLLTAANAPKPITMSTHIQAKTSPYRV